MTRYSLGIDLGTSNSALSFHGDAGAEILLIPQTESLTTIASHATLPSVLYLAPASDHSALGKTGVVGNFARFQASRQPGRVVSSAKSWLAHAGVNREERFLPWGSDDVTGEEKVSPVDASARYLTALREAWETRFGDEAPFSRQSITITVPASFDESAQRLTLRAAQLAGYPADVRLLEEPQAAFYAWLENQAAGDDLLGALKRALPDLENRPQTVLVVDIGGGTTDFSLFEVQLPQGRQKLPRIRRLAVSDHLLLGGDNIDLALAHDLEARLKGSKLSARQWHGLVHAAREVKERALSTENESAAGDEAFRASVASEGAGLFAGAVSATLTRAEIRERTLSGFFPDTETGDRPLRGMPGLKELGLPFAADTSIPRHLAGFLAGNAVDAVLFNGGALKPKFLRARLIDLIARWQSQVPLELVNDDLDLAVARGASYYGAVLRTRAAGAPRISGGYARSVFLELEREKPTDAPRLLCLLPKGTEPGAKIKIDTQGKTFQLLVGKPVRFQLYTASSRAEDVAGDIVALDEKTFHPLPPLQTRLSAEPGVGRGWDGRIDIAVEAKILETGLLLVEGVHRAESGALTRWALEFGLRAEAEADATPASSQARLEVSPETLARARDRIALFYGKKKVDAVDESPKVLRRDLEKILGSAPETWSLPLLRALWTELASGGRGRSPAHEWTWLYLAGLCLRPGYGADLDPWRIAEVWKIFAHGAQFPNAPGNATQWWIFWRRIAGGLSAERQETVLAKISNPLRNKLSTPELVLLAGSLERVSQTSKRELGDLLVRQLERRQVTAIDQHLSALGRLANRAPLYAGASAVLPPAVVEPWLEALLALDLKGKGIAASNLLYSQAGRRTGERAVDLPESLRLRLLEAMRAQGAAESLLNIVEEIVPLDEAAQAELFGENVPAGLRLVLSGNAA